MEHNVRCLHDFLVYPGLVSAYANPKITFFAFKSTKNVRIFLRINHVYCSIVITPSSQITFITLSFQVSSGSGHHDCSAPTKSDVK